MKVIGVMSGSSLDGIDLVMTTFEKDSWNFVSGETYPLPKELRSLLKSTVDQKATELAHTESTFSQYLIDSLLKFMGAAKADLIGIHGHTLLHLPELKKSWQMINGGMVAALTDIPVVCDFRNQDLALGGQGTPMAVISDRDLYPGHDYYINLGGIANISFHLNGRWTAYDLCPCNQLLNYFSQKEGKEYDEGGNFARSGNIHQELLGLLLAEEYILSTPPKSLDNSYISSYIIPKIEKLGLSNFDFLRTILEFVTEVIKSAISQKPGSLFLTGGGTKNTYLIELLNKKLVPTHHNIVIPEDNTIDYKEAILIAYCSYLRFYHRPNFISEATGARINAIGGALYLPAAKPEK